ncbi:hypothetical protein ACFX16_000475 [Malus domestica]
MKRKLDQLQDSKGQIQSDHQRFVAIFQRHFLPSPSGVRPSIETSHDQSSLLLGRILSIGGEWMAPLHSRGSKAFLRASCRKFLHQSRGILLMVISTRIMPIALCPP